VTLQMSLIRERNPSRAHFYKKNSKNKKNLVILCLICTYIQCEVSMKFLGECMGVELTPRGLNDHHVSIKVSIEDDGHWHEQMDFSSSWLNELISTLQMAKTFMENNCKETKYGYEFKTRR